MNDEWWKGVEFLWKLPFSLTWSGETSPCSVCRRRVLNKINISTSNECISIFQCFLHDLSNVSGSVFLQIVHPKYVRRHELLTGLRAWARAWARGYSKLPLKQRLRHATYYWMLKFAHSSDGRSHGTWRLTNHTYLESNWLEDCSIDLPCEQGKQTTGKLSVTGPGNRSLNFWTFTGPEHFVEKKDVVSADPPGMDTTVALLRTSGKWGGWKKSTECRNSLLWNSSNLSGMQSNQNLSLWRILTDCNRLFWPELIWLQFSWCLSSQNFLENPWKRALVYSSSILRLSDFLNRYQRVEKPIIWPIIWMIIEKKCRCKRKNLKFWPPFWIFQIYRPKTVSQANFVVIFVLSR